MAVIGCDPGSPLAMALVSDKGALLAAATWEKVAVFKEDRFKKRKWMNNAVLVAEVLRIWSLKLKKPPHAVIEMAAPRPMEGLVSACKYVGSMYLMQGACAGMDIPFEMVAPSKWKNDMGLNSDKEASRIKALQLWPDKASLFKHKKSHNMAEAALMALWAIEHSKLKV